MVLRKHQKLHLPQPKNTIKLSRHFTEYQGFLNFCQILKFSIVSIQILSQSLVVNLNVKTLGAYRETDKLKKNPYSFLLLVFPLFWKKSRKKKQNVFVFLLICFLSHLFYTIIYFIIHNIIYQHLYCIFNEDTVQNASFSQQ